MRAPTKFLFDPAPSRDRPAAPRGRRRPCKLADGVAEDYFPRRSDWRNRNVRAKRPKLLTDAELNRISREIAHITGAEILPATPNYAQRAQEFVAHG